MKPLLTLMPREEALERLLAALPRRSPSQETLPTELALGRVLSGDVVAPHPLPAFPRSTMDGYAVRAADTTGAGEAQPVRLGVAGEVRMGHPPDFDVGPGQAAVIHTGSALPPGADAVVMVERTREGAAGQVEILHAAAPGENIIPTGEDVRAGQVVLRAGQRLRPPMLGGLMALGIVEVAVARRPRIAILSTGDELVAPDAEPGPNRVRDVNSTTIAALVAEKGGEPIRRGILPDAADTVHAAAREALDEAEALVITAGSSVSARDLTAGVIRRLGAPGVLVHGVTIRPGKPTILGVCGGKPVFGLPGNPVSALNAARLFLVPVVEWLQGAPRARTWTLRARLAESVTAGPGRETFISVRLEERAGDLWAVPIFGESNLIFTLVRGEGLVRIPLGVTGLPAGADVEVVQFP